MLKARQAYATIRFMHLTITHPALAPASSSATTYVPRYVFVYGTLRRGEERDITCLTPAPVFIGTSQTPGTLYHLGACNYPGLRLGGGTWVYGDVYQITPALELQLDKIEHFFPVENAEYSRQELRVQVSIESGATVELTCLTYEISAQRTVGMAVIGSGDWLKR